MYFVNGYILWLQWERNVHVAHEWPQAFQLQCGKRSPGFSLPQLQLLTERAPPLQQALGLLRRLASPMTAYKTESLGVRSRIASWTVVHVFLVSPAVALELIPASTACI